MTALGKFIFVIFVLLVGGAVFYFTSRQISEPILTPTPDDWLTLSPTPTASDKSNLIRVLSPLPNQIVSSPLLVRGEARGFWYFEASFPVTMLDAGGNDIPLNPPYIMTAAEWMTEDFVSFSASLKFSASATETGTLILHKDNPSGLPEQADELIIPIRFK